MLTLMCAVSHLKLRPAGTKEYQSVMRFTIETKKNRNRKNHNGSSRATVCREHRFTFYVPHWNTPGEACGASSREFHASPLDILACR
jgi:hypothetical protein